MSKFSYYFCTVKFYDFEGKQIRQVMLNAELTDTDDDVKDKALARLKRDYVFIVYSRFDVRRIGM